MLKIGHSLSPNDPLLIMHNQFSTISHQMAPFMILLNFSSFDPSFVVFSLNDHLFQRNIVVQKTNVSGCFPSSNIQVTFKLSNSPPPLQIMQEREYVEMEPQVPCTIFTFFIFKFACLDLKWAT